MKTLGLIGGMSWVSTAEYYRMINELVAERLGGLHSARIILESVDFGEIENLKLAGRWTEIGAHLAAAAARLESHGADAIVLCTNTMHYVAETIEDAVTVPFIHIADTTARAITATGSSRVGLLATAFTMESSFYRDRVASHGLEVLTPDAADRDQVSSIIYNELCHNVIRPESRALYLDVVGRLLAEGVEGIILGCTEVELLIGPDDVTVPVFPTTLLHAQAAVDFALSDR